MEQGLGGLGTFCCCCEQSRPPTSILVVEQGWGGWAFSAATAGFLVMEQGLRFLTRSPLALPLFGPLAVERRSSFSPLLCLSVVLGCSLLQCPVQGYMRQNRQKQTNPAPHPQQGNSSHCYSSSPEVSSQSDFFFPAFRVLLSLSV